MMLGTFTLIRKMNSSDAGEVIDLIHRVFMTAVAPYFSEEGIQEFLHYADQDRLLNRQKANHFTLVASKNTKVIGIIEIRNLNHISLLFVDGLYQRMGIGSALCQRAVELCVKVSPDVPAVSVNASPNAVSAYLRMGFVPTDNEKLVNGIRFTPMSMTIN